MIPMQGGVPLNGMAGMAGMAMPSAGGSFGLMDKFAMLDPMKKKLVAALAAQGLSGLTNPRGAQVAGGGLSPELLQMAMSGRPGTM